MNIQELLATLNSHQAAYVNMDLKDPKNGEYMLAVFHLIP
jgi:ribulose-bisphosphate carboxylase large chain